MNQLDEIKKDCEITLNIQSFSKFNQRTVTINSPDVYVIY